MARLIASGGKGDIDGLGAYDSQFREGDRGYLELQLLFIPPGMDVLLDGLDWGLRQAGVVLTRPSEVLEGRRVRIYFKRAIPPLAIIVVALGAVWLVMLLSWRLFKEEARELGVWLLLIVGLVLGAIVWVATKGKLAAPGIAVGG